MSPFEPAGERARWRVVYDLLTSRPTGSTLTYEEMGAALDLDPLEDRHALQMAMRRAAKESEQEDQRAVEPVPNVGYRIVEAPEHLRLAKGQQRRANRALVRGQSKVVNVDLTGVEPEVRKAFEVVAIAFSMQLDFNRRMDVNHRRLAESIEQITERSDRSEAEIAELKERLARLEGQSDGA